MELRKEDGDSFSVYGIGFGFSKREFSKIFNENWIKDDASEVMINEVGDEIKMITTRGFNTDKDGFFRALRESFCKGTDALVVKRVGLVKEDILRGINEAGMKEVFGDIKAYKVGVVHRWTSFYFVLVRQGTCSPILQLDEGLQTQPTYNGLSRQATNSTEGLKAQVKWSCPALLSFPCFNYNPYICKNLGNNITNFS